MKTLFVSIAIFLFSYAYTFSQCPPNWNYISMPFGPDQYGCNYQVEFCYKCGVTGFDENGIRVLNITPLEPENGCISPNRDWLEQQLLDRFGEECSIPACGEDDDCSEVVMHYPLCWQWITRGSFIGGEHVYYSWLEPCDDGYCQKIWHICREYPSNNIVLCPESYIEYDVVDLNCQITDIEQPTEFNPDFEGIRVTSPCFVKGGDLNCP